MTDHCTARDTLSVLGQDQVGAFHFFSQNVRLHSFGQIGTLLLLSERRHLLPLGNSVIGPEIGSSNRIKAGNRALSINTQ